MQIANESQVNYRGLLPSYIGKAKRWLRFVTKHIIIIRYLFVGSCKNSSKTISYESDTTE